MDRRLFCARATAFSCAFIAGAAPGKVLTPRRAREPGIAVGRIAASVQARSGYRDIARVQDAYFAMLNAHGGVDGHKVQIHEVQDLIAPSHDFKLLFALVGTQPESWDVAKHPQKQCPVYSMDMGPAIWNDSLNYALGIRASLDAASEGRAYALDLQRNVNNAKVALLSSHAESSAGIVRSFKAELVKNGQAGLVGSATYDDDDLALRIAGFKAAGANVLLNMAPPHETVRGMGMVLDSGWAPRQYIASEASSTHSVLAHAGLKACIGVISTSPRNDMANVAVRDSRENLEYQNFMRLHLPEMEPEDTLLRYGYASAILLERILTGLHGNYDPVAIRARTRSVGIYTSAAFLPGVVMDSNAAQGMSLAAIQLCRFDGENWKPWGELVSL